MKDICIRAIDKDKMIKAHIAISTNLVETARITHQLSPTATAALGRSLTAGILLRNKLKNENESLTLNILGNGPLGRIVVTGRNNGSVKGYVDNPQADLPIRESDGKLDVGGLVGHEGTLNVVMDLGLKESYTGQVALTNGEIAEDVAHYLLQSEQVASAVGLGVRVDKDLSVSSAGGFIIELLPDATEKAIQKLERSLGSVKSVTNLLEEGLDERELLARLLPEFEMEILEEKEIFFECECSREKVEDSLLSLAPEEIRAMIDEDHGAEVSCHFCNQQYQFDENDLEKIYEESRKKNS
ncbi:Hsp33 family molecular chaperone HslO [Peptoniphilus sp. KCTC 25270]|uniref:Hsp33 family molecular chaperone HslO n=1 Tax=Peptoniphilus sp. KCTC 25270 TaxID=2897414 RepID=UPI001E34507B|nr:Hsp33 family molecular chaperone HslO [Peptoniphilus sp. KCTC 25270]MCD1147994.1 Hsp33 family molecular chaperone HslO [Peptoniphilus sp. KCTC 25270]